MARYYSSVLRIIAPLLLAKYAYAATTAQCCAMLNAALPEKTFSPGNNLTAYDTLNDDFWSSTVVLDPTCILAPTETSDVAQAVEILSKNECKFAIRGGGHSTIPGSNNIDNGVLIFLKPMKFHEIDFAAHTITVGSGHVLGEVYEELDPHNLSAVIGRFYPVGAGGLLVGAGISFFTNRDGLAVDNVLGYEVVLANGTVVEANSTHYPDLHRALKGGNNNFGVVTAFKLRTVSTPGGVYGGIVTYPESSLPQLLDVVYDYHVHGAVEDVLTHVLPQYAYNGSSDEALNFSPIVYNAKVNTLPPSLKGFTDVPHTKSTLRFTNYTDVATQDNAGFSDGMVQQTRTMTVHANKELYSDIWTMYLEWARGYKHIPGFLAVHSNTPITQRAIAQGVAKGRNMLGLENSGDEPLAIFYFGISFDNESDIPELFPSFDNFVEKARAIAKQRNLLHRYIMVTYSGYDQQAIASYGEDNVAFLKQVAKKYDPSAVFERLVPGGQKIPA